MNLAILLLILGDNFCVAEQPTSEDSKTIESLKVLVMDPLAAPLSCDCVPGHGQRRYDLWADQLKLILNRDVEITFNENIGLAQKQIGGKFDLVIGKSSVVRFDLAHEKLGYSPLLKLTNKQGSTIIRGLIVVRTESAIQKVAELTGKTLALGPVEDSETHGAAIDLLREENVFEKVKTKTAGSIDSAVFMLTDKEVDAAVISDFMPSLLEGCGKVAKGSLRVIGKTVHRRFIELFAPDDITTKEKTKLLAAILSLKNDPLLLKTMETKSGFVPYNSPEKTWVHWRGKKQDGICNFLPKKIPEKLHEVWTAKLTGPAMAGIAATENHIVIADKDKQLTTDIIRCLNAKTGKELWSYSYPANQQIDFTNAPRAMPVVCDGLVYTQGAMGDLCCLDVATGKVIWKKHLVDDFAGKMPWWGYSSPPLVDGDHLIFAPGGKETAVIAVNRLSAKRVWKTPGHATAYSAFQIVNINKHRRLIGYDVAGLVAWNPESGKRLWDFIPPDNSDFNVTTPLLYNQHVVLATENNATRLYRLKDFGKKKNLEPIATNEDCAPDTCSPVIWKDRLFCTAYGELFCLDMKNGMKTIWSESGDEFYDHVHLIAGNDRVLAWSTSGDLILFDATADKYHPLRKIRPFGNRKTETMSHPALTPKHIYLRDAKEIKCLAW